MIHIILILHFSGLILRRIDLTRLKIQYKIK